MSGAAGKRHQSGKVTARHTLMTALEDLLNKENLIDVEEVHKAEMEEKFNMITQAIINVNSKFATVHNIINDASDRLEPRMTDCDERMLALTEENKQLRFELYLVKGLHTKLEEENKTLRSKVTSLSALHMKDNLIMHGLCSDENAEFPIQVVQIFPEEIMCLEFDPDHIYTAKRLGRGMPGKPEIPFPMLIHVHPTLRETIMSNLKNLKGKLNDREKPYRILKRLPEEWAEEKRKLQAEFQRVKKINDAKTDAEQKDDIQIKGRQLMVNKKVQKMQYLQAPKASDVFVDKNEQDKLEKLKFATSITIEESGSKFQAYAIKLQSITEAKRAYTRVKQIHPSASHIVAAYNTKGGSGHQDDREFGAGYQLQSLLNKGSFINTTVYVVRYHEGPNLGPRRHILYE